ncbi:MAG: 1-acyl-sn-glycerol-3-phosphate acyltransferase [Bacteroidetes bacterium]|nr:1-acyl-sn-glycerol-3-phosphate acyltransferase [Bacteroidota bacterium]MBS1933539.1 1-acyl-sn-glycerol-3-phosphate acyltransferase [Bacteroidota bacterium]
MKFLLNPLRLIYCLYAFLIFVTLMLLIFPLVLIATFRGKMRGGNFIYKLCRVWANVWLFMIGIRHKNFFEETVDRNKQYIFIANHISYLDIPLILKAVRFNTLRVLGKHEMKRVPIFGYIYRNSAIMVDRSSPDQRSKSVRQLKSVLNKGVSIFVYPEGTFNETNYSLKDFYDGAFRIAIETQTPIKPILFLDTYDRMRYESVFSLNPGRSRALFMDEINVEGLTLRDVQQLKETVYNKMQEVLIENNATWIKNKN